MISDFPISNLPFVQQQGPQAILGQDMPKGHLLDWGMILLLWPF